MEMEHVLEVFFPKKTLEDFLSQATSEVDTKIGDAETAIVDRIILNSKILVEGGEYVGMCMTHPLR
jgi:hypothetical protein